MEKTFILYSEIVGVGDGSMECVYFLQERCAAQPLVEKGQRGLLFYKPDEGDKNAFCKTGAFMKCPRFTAYQNHLKAIGLEK
jgi:hypothetical protein